MYRRVVGGQPLVATSVVGAASWARGIGPLTSLTEVAFRPGLIRGVLPSGGTGVIDYRLARRSLVTAFRRGRLARAEICDAHPELLRAATHLGTEVDELCPICEDENLVLVKYVFGARLPKSGRCVADNAELAKLAAKRDRLACYLVEVCRGCHWNHLARSFQIGGT